MHPLVTPPLASGAARWLPGLQLLRHYPASGWRHDVAAGLVLTTMLVPVGIAYAVASGLPGIHGLYATIAGLLAYALFGPSRIMVMGPDSSLAALILAVVLPLAAGDPARAVALAGAMALAVGLICIAAGLAKLGFITELLSKPIRYGYMNGIALAVIVSQLPKLCGLSVDGDGQHLASEMQRVLDVSHATPRAIVLGARRIAPEQEVAPIKRFGNDFANWGSPKSSRIKLTRPLTLVSIPAIPPSPSRSILNSSNPARA